MHRTSSTPLVLPWRGRWQGSPRKAKASSLQRPPVSMAMTTSLQRSASRSSTKVAARPRFATFGETSRDHGASRRPTKPRKQTEPSWTQISDPKPPIRNGANSRACGPLSSGWDLLAIRQARPPSSSACPCRALLHIPTVPNTLTPCGLHTSRPSSGMLEGGVVPISNTLSSRVQSDAHQRQLLAQQENTLRVRPGGCQRVDIIEECEQLFAHLLWQQPRNYELPDKTREACGDLPVLSPPTDLISCRSPWSSVMDAKPGLPRALRAWRCDTRGRKRPPHRSRALSTLGPCRSRP